MSLNVREVMRAVGEQKLFVILRAPERDQALAAADSVAAAGVRLIDIPVTVPGAMSVIEKLAPRPGLILGAGSVTTMNEAADAIDAGASFIICPHTDRAIIEYCRDNGICVAAGGLTPTEAMVAYLAGVDLVTVYPVHLVGGVEYVHHLLRPMPFLRLMSVGGVTLDNAAAHLRAGALAIGVTDAILEPEALTRGNFDRVRANAAAFLAAVRQQTRER